MANLQDSDLETLIPAWVDGVLTPYGKLAAHQKGLRHKAVSVFVMSGTQTVIQQRALGKYHTPGLWANTCCTHPHWNEPALDCANRRLEQELGISGVTPVHRDQIEYRADVGAGLIEHELVDIYTAEADLTLAITPNPDEVMNFEWVELDDLRERVQKRPEMFTPWLKIYLSEHSDRIFTASA
ncbi:MAG: isopentenyl-diphosphate Delta-isomerase [Pelagimonas sp.]|uniref:isopentenyl-diphosphate Delta-isomerase n=1 Tax=Pelagimonas sp. TaxID=2073170 RepID=UPI003D6BEC4D